MPGISSYLTDFVKAIGATLIPSVKKGVAAFIKKGEGISAKDKIADIVSELRSAWVFVAFVIISSIVFTSLPQGKDILLIVVEDVGINHEPANLIWLLLGVTFWAVLTEYGARYAIYISDNSGVNFLEKRVQWRIALQKVLAAGFLVLPYLCILFSLLVLYLTNTSLTNSSKNIGFGVTAFAVYWVFNVVSRPYLDREYRYTLQAARQNSWFWKIFLLPDKERAYAEKLYGIYNNYVFALPKETWFKGEYRLGINLLYQLFKRPGNRIKKSFPQNTNYLTKGNKQQEGKAVDKEFILVYPGSPMESKEAAEELMACEETPNGYYRWEYKVPGSYFAVLHRQLRLLFLCSVLIIIGFSFGTTSFYQWIGSPGLVFFSFAAWSGIYIGLMYLDKKILRNFPVSIRFVLLVWLLVCSLINADHPVRSNDQIAYPDSRPTLDSHFKNWITAYKQDTLHLFYRIRTADSVYYIRQMDNRTDSLMKAKKATKDTVYPITLVCAEGGALRTGCFAALTLANLQDTLRSLHYNFYKSVYAMSGVSGGAVGLSYFNAVHYLNRPTELLPLDDTLLAQKFFSQDYLAPTLGRLLYGDIINLFLPFNWKIDQFDRAIALETAWERGYYSVIRQGSPNVFSSDFRVLYRNSPSTYPALFINTTEVESGLQCWITNVRPDSLPLAVQRDLLREKGKMNKCINYSTAINFSSRFPIISPGAMVKLDEDKKLHYVDGGYVENTGAATMLEILQFISRHNNRQSTDSSFRQIMPCVLVIKFRDDSKDSEIKNVDFANEFSEVLLGIYNTRSGRADIAEATLKKLTEELGGTYTSFSLSQSVKDVPLNWVFSAQSINNINKDIRAQLTSNKQDNILRKVCFFKK